MRCFYIFIALCAASSALADEKQAFYGIWGTEKQCNREPVKPGGTVLAEPFEITSLWLRQGQLYCALRWGPVEKRGTSFFTGATAQCGEDSIRDYFIGMDLANDELRLRWEFPLSNGPLRRCPSS